MAVTHYPPKPRKEESPVGSRNLQLGYEFFGSDTGKFQNAAKSANGQFTVEWDRRALPGCCIPEYDVATALANLDESEPLQCSDRLLTGNSGQPCHTCHPPVTLYLAKGTTRAPFAPFVVVFVSCRF